MNERFRFNCAYILVLSMLIHSFTQHCASELVKDTYSNNFAETQRDKLDPSIEQIFRSPSEKRLIVTERKLGPEIENSETPGRTEITEKRVRTKRESAAKRSNPKTSSDAVKSELKRSMTKPIETSSRIGRSSRDLPRLVDRESAEDYEAAVDQDKSEYADEVEDESAAGSSNKEASYKGSEFHVNEDFDRSRFVDQEERSSLYDDFETKDVVKRGISASEDYEEEVDDESVRAAEDAAAFDERESLDEEAGKRKVRGDVRVKRDRENSKKTENVGMTGKEGSNDGPSSDSEKDAETSLKDVKSDKDARANDDRASKDFGEQGDQAKRNAAEKNENEVSKANLDREPGGSKQSLTMNDQTEVESNENAKSLNVEVSGDRKTQEEVLSSDKQGVGETQSLGGTSKHDETKIADVSNPEATKAEAPSINTAEAQGSEDAAKLETSGNSEATSNEQADADYEKRVEEQIQRKIDSIKEEIKREIADNQRIKEIEENNAKFDEMHEREDEEEEQEAAEQPEKRVKSLSKRSPRNSGKPRTRNTGEKRSVKRKKRQNDGSDRAKARSAGESTSNGEKRSIRETAKKRSSLERLAPIKKITPMKKRASPRQIYFVRNDRDAGKKGRRRSRSEEGQGRVIHTLPADVALELKLHGDLSDDKSGFTSKASEDEKAIAEQSSLSNRKSGSVASLTGSNEELGPLATEYGDAFGGLQGEPGVALARFKRIKRVLRPQTSKT